MVIDRDLLRQVVTWAISVGLTTGMPAEGEEFEETLSVRCFVCYCLVCLISCTANFDATPVMYAKTVRFVFLVGVSSLYMGQRAYSPLV